MKKILALYDRDKLYVKRMTEYLQSREELPFEVYAYTEAETLAEFAKDKKIHILVAAESVYTADLEKLPVEQTILLNESGKVLWEKAHNVDKYQQAEEIYKEMMRCYLERTGEGGKNFQTMPEAKLIGFYSPIRRCLQTSFALTLGQILSGRYRTLYISFEHYAGWNDLIVREGKADLSDLLCFLEESEEKFRCRLRVMEEKIGRLFYIPPVYAGQNLVYITGAQWQGLLEKIRRSGGYEYIILDLSEGLQGVYELLRMCIRIFTMVKEDSQAMGKILQYEQLLRLQDCEDILERTSRQELPFFRHLPIQMEQYTKGELAEYVRRILKKELGLEEV